MRTPACCVCVRVQASPSATQIFKAPDFTYSVARQASVLVRALPLEQELQEKRQAKAAAAAEAAAARAAGLANPGGRSGPTSGTHQYVSDGGSVHAASQLGQRPGGAGVSAAGPQPMQAGSSWGGAMSVGNNVEDGNATDMDVEVRACAQRRAQAARAAAAGCTCRGRYKRAAWWSWPLSTR